MIQFEKIAKRFPGVAALQEVTFAVATAGCHALLGENGAGKSTLGKILAGMYRPDGGQVLIDGREVRFSSPRDAALAGVGIVHQELIFCPNLSVAENLCLHDLPRRGLFLDRRALRSRAEALLAQVGLAIAVERPLASLSIAQEQLVQIAAAVGLGAKILVFDEPTSSLGPGEVERLFQLIRRLQKAGTTIIYVSHRLEEIFELCQTVTVLRDGRHVATQPVGSLTHDDLVRMMVGRAIDRETALAPEAGAITAESGTRTSDDPTISPFPLVGDDRGGGASVNRPATSFRTIHGQLSETPDQPRAAHGTPRLQCRRFSSPGRFSDIQLDVHAGEIVGLAGLVGAGRTEILEALFGLDHAARGEIVVDGKRRDVRSPRDAQAAGMTLVPEDRQRQGLVLAMNVRENLTLSILDRLRRLPGIADHRAERALAERFRQSLSIRTPSVEAPVTALSGGNQQKIVFARGLAADRRVLLVDEPTRGVDVGAKREIHDLLRRLAADGTAVLLVSSDLPELLALAHRVVVLRQGQIVAELPGEGARPDAVLRAMAGISTASA